MDLWDAASSDGCNPLQESKPAALDEELGKRCVLLPHGMRVVDGADLLQTTLVNNARERSSCTCGIRSEYT